MSKASVKGQMFVREAISYGKTFVSPLEAEVLLSFVLRCSREHFITHPEHKISKEHAAEFKKYCDARANGIPLAYLTHHKEFYGLDFYVDERVLIPRPETELLVEKVLSFLQPASYNLHFVLDVGTGSGCIAIALAKHLPHTRVVAVDISEGALEVARKNAEFHKVSSRIEFMKSDLLLEISSRSFDGIVANLPYIGTKEQALVSREVLGHEPHSAIFSGENGLELYERLFTQIRALPKLSKWFIGEMGFLQQKAIGELIRKYFGKVSIIWKNDLAGLMRLFIIYF